METLSVSQIKKEINKSTPGELRRRVREDSAWIQKSESEREWREIRLAHTVKEIRDEGYWKEWKREDGDKFKSFNDWLETECTIGKRTKVYELIGIVERLPGISMQRMMSMGKTACASIARVGRHKPSQVAKVIEHVEEALARGEPLSAEEVKQVAENVIAGQNPGSQRYMHMEFMVPMDQEHIVRKALAVMDLQHPVEDPESPLGMGLSLVKIAAEYLSGNLETRILKDLEKAGKFDASRFRLA
jgi:hypothetical protein